MAWVSRSANKKLNQSEFLVLNDQGKYAFEDGMSLSGIVDERKTVGGVPLLPADERSTEFSDFMKASSMYQDALEQSYVDSKDTEKFLQGIRGAPDRNARLENPQRYNIEEGTTKEKKDGGEDKEEGTSSATAGLDPLANAYHLYKSNNRYVSDRFVELSEKYSELLQMNKGLRDFQQSNVLRRELKAAYSLIAALKSELAFQKRSLKAEKLEHAATKKRLKRYVEQYLHGASEQEQEIAEAKHDVAARKKLNRISRLVMNTVRTVHHKNTTEANTSE
eukprot:g363.t1